MKSQQPSLFDVADATPPTSADPPDRAAREFAVDPANDVVLEASAGTGKTRVLVERYVRLMQADVDPRHVLAMTFTRKAAAEMRDRVIAELRRRAADGTLAAPAWARLRDRLVDIEISTIDAFCFSLLREFPLEADIDPAFEIADETEMARFVDQALDLTLHAVRPLLVEDEAVRLLFARIKLPVLRRAIAQLVDRREIAQPAIAGFVKRHGRVSDSAEAARRFADRLRRDLDSSGVRGALLDEGPHGSPQFVRLHADLSGLDSWPDEPVRAQQVRRRLETYFLTRQGTPRQRLARAFTASMFTSSAARTRHEAAVRLLAPQIAETIAALDADVDGLLARGRSTPCSISPACSPGQCGCSRVRKNSRAAA
jgi:ATP-dependent exoDNAse (exonuclease V) beta subunit